MKFFNVIFLTFWAVSLTFASESNVQSVIAHARAAVGAETVLDNLVTLQMSGRIHPGESRLSSATISITARKPCSQRLEVTFDDLLETTIVEGNRGCIIRSNQSHVEEVYQIRMMTPEEVQRVAFNTRQLFSFYKADSKNNEFVIYDGIDERRGLSCHKLRYAYPNGMTTTRYFAVNDHALVSIITDKGVESVEIGEWIVDGIRFPKQIEYYHENKKLHTLILDKIEVNKPLRSGVFTIPKVQKKREI